jgi:hypothetical protein
MQRDNTGEDWIRHRSADKGRLLCAGCGGVPEIPVQLMAAPRKSFSGRGRKARGLVPLREPNGNYQRPLKQERVADVVAIAMAQPHRRLAENPRAAELATPIGRLIHSSAWCAKDGPRSRAAELLVDAAKRYQDDYAGWQWANESRRAWKNATWRAPRVFSTQEEENDAVNDHLKKWSNVEGEIRRTLNLEGRNIGPECSGALQALVLDSQHEDWIVPQWIVYYGEIALGVLVKFYGLDQKR